MAATLSDTTAPVITRIRPAPGYYADRIPLIITATDEYMIRSITVQVSKDLLNWTNVYIQSYVGVNETQTLIQDPNAESNTVSYSAAHNRVRLLYFRTSGTLAPCTDVLKLVIRIDPALTQAGSVTLPVTVKIVTEDSRQITLTFSRSLDLIREYVGDAYDPRKVVIEEVKQAQDNAHGPRATLFGCGAGMNQYTISHDGKLLGCQMMGVFSADARKLGLAKAWEEFPRTVKLPPVHEKCRTCPDKRYCNTCFASRYAETGELGGCPAYVCKDVAMMRRLIQKVVEYDEHAEV